MSELWDVDGVETGRYRYYTSLVHLLGTAVTAGRLAVPDVDDNGSEHERSIRIRTESEQEHTSEDDVFVIA